MENIIYVLSFLLVLLDLLIRKMLDIDFVQSQIREINDKTSKYTTH